MKRYLKLFAIVVIGVFLLTGCEEKKKEELKEDKTEKTEKVEEKVMTCTRTATISEGVTMSLEYTVTHDGTYVKKVKSHETVTANDSAYLEAYKKQVESIYSPYKNVEYYTYSVRVEGNTLISDADIDYEHIDTSKMIEVDSANATLIKDGKVKVSDIKSLYATVGATCN